MANFVFTHIPKKMWTIVIDGETYSVPMATSMTHEEALKIHSSEGTYDYFRTYIGEIYETLTTAEQNQIVNAWVADNNASGVKPGE